MAITTLNNRSINRSDTAASGQLWTATSATASDFQAAAAGGKIGQVLQARNTSTTSLNSATWTDIASLTIDITPVATSSKVLVMCDINTGGTDALYFSHFRIVRDSTTDIYVGAADGSRERVSVSHGQHHTQAIGNLGPTCLDSPSTTSTVTYKVQWRVQMSLTVYLNRGNSNTDSDTYPRAVSSITVMEVLA